MHMMFMRLFAFLVKNIFRVYEGSEKYKRFERETKRGILL